MEQEQDAEQAKFAEMAQDPVVKVVLDTFEGARVTNVIALITEDDAKDDAEDDIATTDED